MGAPGDGPSTRSTHPLCSDGEPIDPDALLVALVIAPSCLARNRHPSLYQDQPARRARRRAAAVRGIGAQLLRGIGGVAAEVERVALQPDLRTELVYRVPRLGLRRAVSLSATEMVALRWVIRHNAPAQRARGRRQRIASGIECLLGDSAGTRASLIGVLSRLVPKALD